MLFIVVVKNPLVSNYSRRSLAVFLRFPASFMGKAQQGSYAVHVIISHDANFI
jgi:hypothetical protein